MVQFLKLFINGYFRPFNSPPGVLTIAFRRIPLFSVISVAGLLFAGPARAEDAVQLQEAVTPERVYHVESNVSLSGTLTLPPEKDGSPARTVAMAGMSV